MISSRTSPSASRDVAASAVKDDLPARNRANGKLIETIRKGEIKKCPKPLWSRRGLDFACIQVAAGPSEDEFDVEVSTDKTDNTVTAGAMQLSVTVKNNSERPVYRLRARASSDSGYFNERELIFGKIEAGEGKTAKTPCRGATSKSDAV